MNDEQLEQEIIEKGLTAPRVTLDTVKQKINKVDVYRFPDTTVTVVLLTLENGFTVIGESACASPENFNEELGYKLALDHAQNKIWALEGYLLKQRLYEATLREGK